MGKKKRFLKIQSYFLVAVMVLSMLAPLEVLAQENTTQELLDELCEVLYEDTTEELSEEFSEETSEENSDGVPEETSEENSEEVPEETSEEKSEEVSEEASEEESLKPSEPVEETSEAEDVEAGGDIIAEGQYENVSWKIDSNGKLTVEGKGNFKDRYDDSPWYSYRDDIISAEINLTGTTDASDMFYGCSSLISLDVSNFDTTNVTNMGFMFSDCTSLTSLDVSKFDTSNVGWMNFMFSDCTSLTSLDVSSFDTSNVTTMELMFSGCSSLTSLDVSNFDTSNVIRMNGMFYGCTSLTGLDVSNFDTSNVGWMDSMFYGCTSLTGLDVSNFDTSNVTLMYGMFSDCTSLTSLDVSNFDTSCVTSMSSMFYGCTSLTSLDLKNFDTSSVTSMGSMFSDCDRLERINTPLNVQLSTSLPHTMYDKNGTAHTILPMNLSESIELRTSWVDVGETVDFNQYTYRADYIINNELPLQYVIDFINEETYCEEMTAGISRFEAFLIEFARNKMGVDFVKDPLSYTQEAYEIKSRDLYSALIIKLLKNNTQESTSELYAFAVETKERWFNGTKTKIDGFDYTTKIAELPLDTKSEYINSIKEAIDKDKKNVLGNTQTDEIIDGIDTIFDAAETIGDVWTIIQNNYMLYQLENDTKKALEYWRESAIKVNGENMPLVEALDSVIACTQSIGNDTVLILCGEKGAHFVYKIFWDELLGAVKSKFPAVTIALCCFELGGVGYNFLANTDAIVEEKINCVVMSEIIASLDYACLRSINQYKESPTEANARNMLELINLMMGAHMMDKDCMINFAKALDGEGEQGDINGTGNRIFRAIFPSTSHAKAIEGLTAEKDYLNQRAQYLQVLWITQLKTTHPGTGLYEFYKSQLIDAQNKINKKSYSFACPVDVTVSLDSVESYVRGGKVHAADGTVILLEGDKKTIILTNDYDYKIALTGTDIGTMTVTVKDYDENGNAAIYKSYKNVTLSKDISYIMNASNTNNSNNFHVLLTPDESKEIVPETLDTHKITVQEGTIEFEYNKGTSADMAQGETATIMAIDKIGYRFGRWEVNGDAILEDSSSKFTTVIAGNKDSVLTAIYVKICEVYTITTECNRGGRFFEDGNIQVEAGSDKTIYFIPDEGYMVHNVLVDDVSLGAIEEYTFADINQNHVVKVIFVDEETAKKQGDILPEDFPEDGIIPNGIWIKGIKDETYTGSAVKQSFRVYDGNKLLKEKTDYTVAYKNNKAAYTYSETDSAFNAKKAPQIVIKMKGNYSGSKTIYFKIQQAEISKENIESEKLTITYSGKKQTPVPTVTVNGKKLKYGNDFTIPEYDAAKKDKTAFTESNTYPITVVGKGNYMGEVSLTLTISEGAEQIAMNKVTVKGVKNLPWTGAQVTQEGYAVSYKKDVLDQNSGEFTVSYGENLAVGNGTMTLTGTGEDKDGDGLSYIGSKTISFKISGTTMSKVTVSGVEKQYVYTGAEIKPVATLKYKANKTAEEITLQEEVHYTVSYRKNIAKGTATVTFTGLAEGGFTGVKKATFKIGTVNISDVTDGTVVTEQVKVSFVDNDRVVNGVYVAPIMKGGVKPEIIVKEGETVLKEGTDYTVSYGNNKAIALSTDKKAPVITIKGKGNYTGSKKVYFTITGKPLTNENGILISAKDKVANGIANGYVQSFKVYDADGKALTTKDYDAKTITYTLIQKVDENGIIVETDETLNKTSVVEAGSMIQISVTGIGAYAGGTASGIYRIINKACDISKATIRIAPQEYTGEAVEITRQDQFVPNKVFIKTAEGNKELVLGRDIEVVEGSYVKNVNKGTAKVTFRGIGEYGGIKTVSYKIGSRSIMDVWAGIYSRMAELFG